MIREGSSWGEGPASVGRRLPSPMGPGTRGPFCGQRSTGRRSPAGHTTCGMRRSRRGSTAVSLPRRLPGGPVTAWAYCSRSTQSASTARRPSLSTASNAHSAWRAESMVWPLRPPKATPMRFHDAPPPDIGTWTPAASVPCIENAGLPLAWVRPGHNWPVTAASDRGQSDLDSRHALRIAAGHAPFGLVTTRCPRQGSNLRTWFRKPLLYPLSYEGGRTTAPSCHVGAAHEAGPATTTTPAASERPCPPAGTGPELPSRSRRRPLGCRRAS